MRLFLTMAFNAEAPRALVWMGKLALSLLSLVGCRATWCTAVSAAVSLAGPGNCTVRFGVGIGDMLCNAEIVVSLFLFLLLFLLGLRIIVLVIGTIEFIHTHYQRIGSESTGPVNGIRPVVFVL